MPGTFIQSPEKARNDPLRLLEIPYADHNNLGSDGGGSSSSSGKGIMGIVLKIFFVPLCHVTPPFSDCSRGVTLRNGC